MFSYHSSLKNLRAERSCSAESHRRGEVGAMSETSHCSCSVWQPGLLLLRGLMHDRSPCEGWPTTFLPQKCCLFPNIPNMFPNDSTKTQAYSVKGREVVVLKPNSVCHVHPKCWERKIRRDTCRCRTVNGGCRMGTMQNACFFHFLMLMNRRSRSQKRVTSVLQHQ